MVSIIIPVYNVAPYIVDCLESVMRQTYNGDMECIVVDDCGTDDSIAIAERMIEVYTGPIRFLILHHNQNRGLSAARNTGTLQAKGDFIYYLDSDDWITDDCIEKLMAQTLQNPDIEMVQGNAKKNAEGDLDPTIHFPDKPIKANKEVRMCFYHKDQLPGFAWNKLIRRSFINDNHLLFKDGIIYEDLLWVFYLLKHVRYMCFVTDITYHYRKRKDSITTGTDKKTIAYHRCIIFQDIITHLTPGHNLEEFQFYVGSFAEYYRRNARLVPIYRKVFPLYWEKGWELKCYSFCIRLSVTYVLGWFKWGDELYSWIRKCKHNLNHRSQNQVWG